MATCPLFVLKSVCQFTFLANLVDWKYLVTVLHQSTQLLVPAVLFNTLRWVSFDFNCRHIIRLVKAFTVFILGAVATRRWILADSQPSCIAQIFVRCLWLFVRAYADHWFLAWILRLHIKATHSAYLLVRQLILKSLVLLRDCVDGDAVGSWGDFRSIILGWMLVQSDHPFFTLFVAGTVIRSTNARLFKRARAIETYQLESHLAGLIRGRHYMPWLRLASLTLCLRGLRFRIFYECRLNRPCCLLIFNFILIAAL